MLSLARALVRRGHRVWFGSAPSLAGDARAAGIEFVELPQVRISPLEDLRLYEDAERFARAFLPHLASLAPDVMVCDLVTFGPALAAEVLGIPYASLLIHGLHLPSRELPPFGRGRPPGRTPLGRAWDAWMRTAHHRDLERARDELNVARTALGLAPTEALDGYVSPLLLMVATLPSLEIPRADWPARAHVIGPCLWERPANGFHVDIPAGDGPLVLIAGSTAQKSRLVGGAVEAAARLGVRAVVTTGASAMRARLPRGVVASEYAPHGQLLRIVDAVVSNGGHGVVARSLAAGRPLVVSPGGGDQRENGWRVQRSGAGVAVHSTRPRALTRALRAVLYEPRFRQRAAAIAAEASTLDGPTRAAELLEALALGGRPVTG
jgi:UDP:flavonoid glycosyltransferase YjiC (YdhE family)